MATNPAIIGNLLARQKAGLPLSDEELALLLGWANESPANEAAYREMMADEWTHPAMQHRLTASQENSWEKLVSQIAPNRSSWETGFPRPLITPFRLMVVIAACFFGAVLSYWIWSSPGKPFSDYSALPPAPGTIGRSIILYADGTQVPIDSPWNGQLLGLPGVNIQKSGTTIRYGKSKSSLFNAVLSARKQQYHLILPDGSEVWLNAESMLRFPVTFPENARRVELLGQAYFKISPDAKRPFSVVSTTRPGDDSSFSINVLGTSFDCRAYPGDSSLVTTLLEGAVQISVNHRRLNLSAPRKAVLIPSENNLRIEPIRGYVDWRDSSRFDFENTSLSSVLEQWSHWYHVGFHCPGPLLTKWYVNGEFLKTNSLSDNLEVLSAATHLRWKRSGDTVYLENTLSKTMNK